MQPPTKSNANDPDNGRISDATLDQIRRINSQQVAEAFRLKRDSGKHFECPACSSSDAFRVKPEADSGGHCFSCGTNASDNIALVGEIRGLEFTDAVHAAANSFGIPVEYVDGQRRQRSSPRQQANGSDDERTDETPADYPQRERAAIQWESRLSAAYKLLADIWECLDLEEAGAEYLEGRGLAFDGIDKCVRSTSRRRWRAIVEGAPDDQLRDAGIAYPFLRPDWPVDGDHPAPDHMLVFAYLDDSGDIDTLRFREADDGKSVMGLAAPDLDTPDPALSPHYPSGPYLSDIATEVARDCGLPMYVVEGEFDALSMWVANRPAVAAPGAGFFKATWTQSWSDLEVLIIGDGDEGGGNHLDAVLDAIEDQPRLSARWLRRQQDDFNFGPDLDANDLLQRGDLRAAINIAERQSPICTGGGVSESSIAA